MRGLETVHHPRPATGAGASERTTSWPPADPSGEESLPGVAIRLADDAALSRAGNRIRQSRLRAAALGLAAWWGLISVQSLFVGPGGLVPLVLTLALATAAGWLSRHGPIPPARLRALELAVFGVCAAAFSISQYDILRAAAARMDAPAFHIAIKNALINAMTLMLAYAVLIPNSWRSALPGVLGLALYPMATTWAVARVHPEIFQLFEQSELLEIPGLTLTMTAVAAGLSLYGIHILGTLRTEVYEARRLNQYQLGELIGTGGMGEVYLAEHRLLKRACAIKLIHPWSARDPVALDLFEREVRATARLSHPNVVEIYDYGRADDGTFYYVMEYLSGLSLGELVQRCGPLPPGRVIHLLTQVCEGLAEAHAAGLIHRDIKPTNLFAAQVGRRCDVAKVLDFGLVMDSRATDESRDREEGVVGTLSFMAPEQRANAPGIDHRADLFAVGAVAYFLLTGRLPFADANGFRPVSTSAANPLVPPSRHEPGIPADLERVILQCLAPAPADRYPDAERLRDALASCEAAGGWDHRQASQWWHGAPTAAVPEGSA